MTIQAKSASIKKTPEVNLRSVAVSSLNTTILHTHQVEQVSREVSHHAGEGRL